MASVWMCGCAVQEHADSLTFSFEAPLKEYVRMVKSAKAVMADRSLALSTLQSARSDVDGKRTKLAKLRGTPGIKVSPCYRAPWLARTQTCSIVQLREWENITIAVVFTSMSVCLGVFRGRPGSACPASLVQVKGPHPRSGGRR